MFWLSGLELLRGFFKKLPRTKHTVRSFDAQPAGVFPAGTATSSTSCVISILSHNSISILFLSGVLVTVAGDVKYGISPLTHKFHHTFVLDHHPSKPGLLPPLPGVFNLSLNPHTPFRFILCSLRCLSTFKRRKRRGEKKWWWF